jgi:ABC-2 type transport system permease protein
MVISTPAFILSGFTWPSLAMPPAITAIAEIIPVTHFLNGFRNVLFYDGGISSISHEIFMLLLIFIGSLFAMLVLLQLKIKKSRKNTLVTSEENFPDEH